MPEEKLDISNTLLSAFAPAINNTAGTKKNCAGTISITTVRFIVLLLFLTIPFVMEMQADKVTERLAFLNGTAS